MLVLPRTFFFSTPLYVSLTLSFSNPPSLLASPPSVSLGSSVILHQVLEWRCVIYGRRWHGLLLQADARLKCSVNARRRDTDTSERQKNETFNAKQNTQPLSNAQRRRVCRTSGGLKHRCGDLQIFAGNGNFSIRIMSF